MINKRKKEERIEALPCRALPRRKSLNYEYRQALRAMAMNDGHKGEQTKKAQAVIDECQSVSRVT